MDEYTPTTHEVREKHAVGARNGAEANARRNDFDRWLAEHDREVAEDAWDEGYDQGIADDGGYALTTNPYRTTS